MTTDKKRQTPAFAELRRGTLRNADCGMVDHEIHEKSLFRGEPQMRFALPRGFAVSGLFLGDVTQGDALEDSRFALGYYRSPIQGFRVAASPTVEIVTSRCDVPARKAGGIP